MPVKLQGMQQLKAQLLELEKKIDKKLKEDALIAGAEIMKEKVKESAPVRTGILKANIIVSDVKNSKIHIGPDQQGKAFYGHFLEFGTSKMSAQPFMGPAFENNQDEAQEKMMEVIKRELGI